MTSTTPRTTDLGPDQATLRKLMRRLAEASSENAPILSVYVDIRPGAHGERPAERPEGIVVRDRLRGIAASIDAHTPARESVDADSARIERFLETQDLDGTDGVAMFACNRVDLWETARAREAFETQIAARPTADLFQLARLLDDSLSALVAVVDTSTCRLFVTRHGGIEERSGRDEPPDEHRRHAQGGWSQARYQRHIDMQDKRFAKEAATALEKLVERERADHVIVAGDERSTPLYLDVLSEAVRARVDEVIHLPMRSSRDDVAAAVAPILSAIEEAEGRDVADRAIAGWLAGDLGIAGMEATRGALELGQVHELVIDDAAGIPENQRAELVRQAALTDARVEIVREHPDLAQVEGVAATLRFKI
jgi:peptide chain release factor subunit 1